jgi:hypothetical protein
MGITVSAASNVAGTWYKIAATTLVAPGAFAFSSIPSGFRAFWVIINGTFSGAGQAGYIYFNADNAGTSYAYEYVRGVATVATSATAAAQPYAGYHIATGGTGYHMASIYISNNATTSKGYVSTSGDTGANTVATSGVWASNTEINTITVLASTNFGTGTTCTLWAVA